MLKRQVSFKNVFVSIYIVAIIALLILPVLKYSIRYIPIIVFTVPFIFIYCLQKNRNKYIFYITAIVLALLFTFSFLINAPLSFSNAINLSLLTYLCFLPFFIFDYLTVSNNKFEIKFVITATFIIMAFIMVITLKEIAVNPMVARALAVGTMDDEYVNVMRMKNVGGFGYSYAVGMFVPYLTALVIKSKGKKRAVYTALLILLFVYAVLSQYTTLLILSMVFCAIVVLIDGKSIVGKILLLFFALVILLNLKSLLKFLGTNLPFKQLSDHFWLMYVSFETGEETTSRLDSIRRCVGLFRSHPIFGVNIVDSYNSYVLAHAHSSYFPLIAGNGIVGSALYFFSLSLILKNLILRNRKKLDYIMIFVMYIVLGIINPTHNVFEISVVVFMLIPLIEYYNSEFKEESNV